MTIPILGQNGSASPGNKPFCVIFDLDGVLANCPESMSFIDWSDQQACEELMSSHPPESRLIWMLNLLRGVANVHMVVMTGRPNKFRSVTASWLSKYNVRFHQLFMRHDEDVRHDFEIKKEMLQALKDRYEIWFVVEDRDSVVDMWRGEGILCLQPRRGNY